MPKMGPEILSAVIVVSLIILMLSLVVIFVIINYKKKQQIHTHEKKLMKEEFEKQFLQSQIEVQEQTFQQIGKELHDNVGQLLSTSRMLIGLTERELKTPPDTLLTANATLGQAIAEIRSLAKSLDKDWLERFSFSENIQTVIDRMNAGALIQASYEEHCRLSLRSDEQIVLFRIVQEAVQNAVKHANPATISIRTQEEQSGYKIRITDDGCGFDVELAKRSLGILNMEHRTRLLGGRINIRSRPGNGTEVSIYLPNQTKLS
jgi:signal transduction histidine kinase